MSGLITSLEFIKFCNKKTGVLSSIIYWNTNGDSSFQIYTNLQCIDEFYIRSIV